MQIYQPKRSWDPIVTYWNGVYFLYCLETSQEGPPFWLKKNHIHLYKSPNLKSWIDCGPVLFPKDDQEILCAGSIILKGPYLFYFYSVATLIKLDKNTPREKCLADQELRLARSTDGIHFENCDDFYLPPDPLLYPSGRQHPVEKRSLYAWRDPYVLYCDSTQKYYIYIVTGGGLWKNSPTIAVARSENLEGPYTLLAPALKVANFKGLSSSFCGELEKIDIKYLNGTYYLFGSAWHQGITPEFKSFLKSKKLPISNYNTYVFRSNHPEGPFELFTENPIIKYRHSWIYPGIYGKYFYEDSDGSILVCGWQPPLFRMWVEKSLKLTFNKRQELFILNYDLKVGLEALLNHGFNTRLGKFLHRLNRYLKIQGGNIILDLFVKFNKKFKI
ncbi:hypothetical protein [Oscillatoria sp. HE19RPO]|uniref:hypothetical protein n=1 Tax=Oscillatoria sp. HE19RPO TaxID=2954806 RepID=UPI0020C43BFC|nr:hypothetical protein [Oscillatoria sp. HE19RPO]